jgi:membrane-bound serine protease (ClpP class)
MIPLTGWAQSEGGGIDVIDVSGPLDAGALEFMNDAILASADRGQELAVLQLNSPAVLDEDAFHALVATIESPPLPVAVWIGPAPASAYGGTNLLALAPGGEAAISPGSTMGLISPLVAGSEKDADARFPKEFEEVVMAEDTGLPLQPSIRQYLQDLNGVSFSTGSGDAVVETIEPFDDGVTLKTVTFHKPGIGLRYFRLGATPETAFFFLVVGLTVVSFEFFAIGPGVAAGVATLSLLIAGWGVVNLPVRWWALALAIAGWVILTASYQRGGIIALTALGALMLQGSGMFFVDGSGQIDPRWWLILPSVLAVLFFFLLGMPTVQRARFSTQTIGREGLIGDEGVALVDFDPNGLVEVNGAQWRASAHREAGVVAGSRIVVTGVDGMFLEVDRIA